MFVLLSFCPKILEKENAKMREIVDKHFPDNWVIPIYQGHLVDVTEYWKPFPAA
jgi:WASH complex subunit strumpellin